MMPGKPKDKLNQNPGPGRYSVENLKLKHTPSATIGDAKLESSISIVVSPGPANYNTALSCIKLEGFAFGKQRARSKENIFGPGP